MPYPCKPHDLIIILQYILLFWIQSQKLWVGHHSSKTDLQCIPQFHLPPHPCIIDSHICSRMALNHIQSCTCTEWKSLWCHKLFCWLSDPGVCSSAVPVLPSGMPWGSLDLSGGIANTANQSGTIVAVQHIDGEVWLTATH